uniref:Uncharacterized protein n=1 Tax=Helianthus annuus TaxID=4232 RepID=A0A251SU02_HELAN
MLNFCDYSDVGGSSSGQGGTDTRLRESFEKGCSWNALDVDQARTRTEHTTYKRFR